MKNYKNYIVGILALAVGLLIGKFIFSSKNANTTEIPSQQIQQTEEQIWTCSMHPQIRQNEPGDCPICGMDLIPLDENQGSDNPAVFQMTDNAVKMANIQTTIVGKSTNSDGSSLKLNGKIQSDETRAASLVSHIPGRIEKLYVSFTGEQVNKGQKIASIYSPNLVTAQKELIEAQKIIDISPGLFEAAKNKLRYWKISDSTIEEILLSGEVKEIFDIHADHSGIVSKRKVSVGDYLSTGEVLFDIQNLYRVWALFEVYENDLTKIKVGSQVEFNTPSMPNKTFKAKITFIDPVINPQTRVATVRAEVSNSSMKLKPEMFIVGHINTAQKSSLMSVPKTAVLWTGQRSVVYVKVPDLDIPSFEYMEIELGKSSGNEYMVVSGLETGDEVVTNGAFVIDASAQLNNQASMMNRNVMLKDQQHTSHLPDYTSTTPKEFKDQLRSIVMSYLTLKDALVASDVKNTEDNANTALNAVENVDMSLVEGDAHIYWMDQVKAIQSHGKKITELNDIDEQRKQFDFLSKALIKSVKVFGVTDDTFYVQYCPMAFDNTGATWLSDHEKILNPYFGKKMLKCGSIQDTIDNNFRNPPMQQQSNPKQNLHIH